jgi:soluble lytic murein transglycosylase-like protein
MNTNIKIPSIPISFYKTTDMAQIKSKIDTIMSSYGVYINNSAKISNVQRDLISSVIFIESAGKVDAVSPAGAVGLMQIAPISATDILVIENKQKRLNDAEKKILENHIGKQRLAEILKMTYMGQKQVITKADLLNPELNILIGTIYLGLLIYEETENGKVRLDKVILRYNAGYNAHSKGKNLKGDINNVIKTVNKESSTYIVKLLGKNGVLDSIV